eukprot:CAMPEP_0197521062 /NCGR_PEP_ID=MMETSP1318-20131121/6363_1 /TAXON_ID=552666 /ORGANISM="Partenskyella glossopodia, Strain RCC365" /LENGTH=181 /DNA_ID=CAMNT_0043072887 /DNA_START=162 /DNA_END=707 /DNA_ORIENTATION=+
MVYQKVNQNFEPDWDGVDLTPEEISNLQEHLDDLDDMDFDDDMVDDAVADLETLEKELQNEATDEEDSLPPFASEPSAASPPNLDPAELTNHIESSTKKSKEDQVILKPPESEAKLKRRKKASRREAKEAKERSRTNLLKKEVKLVLTPDAPDKYDIQSLLDDDEDIGGGWDADLMTPTDQ